MYLVADINFFGFCDAFFLFYDDFPVTMYVLFKSTCLSGFHDFMNSGSSCRQSCGYCSENLGMPCF